MLSSSQPQWKGAASTAKQEFGMPRQALRTQQQKIMSPNSSVAGKAQPEFDWEREIESLDQKEMELHQTQMKLIREQMMSFTRDLAGMKEAFDEMRMQRETEAMQAQALQEELHRDKQEMQTEIMALIAALQEDSKGHSSKLDEVAQLVGDGMLEDRMLQSHSALENRIAELHQMHGEATEKHGNALDALRASHDSHASHVTGHKQQLEALQATIPERLTYLEKALGDSASQHTGKLDATLAKIDQLHQRLSTCESQGSSLKQMHGDLAKDKDTKHASLQERVDYLEGMLGDSADKHAKELDALKTAHEKHSATLSQNSKFLDDHKGEMTNHHSTLQERVDEIEQILGLQADKHGDGLADATSKMELLHSRLVEVERFGAALEELRKSHGNLSKEKQELAGQHSLLKDRLDSMDQAFGDNFDKHGKHLQALATSHDKHVGAMSKHSKDLEALRAERQAHHENLVGRLDTVEQAHGEARDQHALGVSQLQSKHQGLLERLASFEKHGHHIGNLQRSHDALATKKAELESSHASMGDRVSYLEQMLGDSVEKHAKELRALRDSHSKHSNDLEGLRCLHSKHSTVDERLDYIEKCIGTSADKHAEEVSQLKRSHEALHGRLVACENHGPIVSELRKSHGGLAAKKAQLETQHASLKERVDYLEGILNDSADKHAEKLEAAHAKLGEMHSRVAACERFGPSVADLKKGHAELYDHKNAMDSHHASTKERLDNIEALFGDATNRQTKELKGLKGLHDKLSATLTKHASQLDGFTSHQEHHASIPERVTFLEQQFGDDADKHRAEVAELHKKLAREQAAREKHHGSIKELMAREQEERGSHHASLSERVDYLEQVLGDNAEKHAREIAQVVSGHQKLSSEIKSRTDGHGSVADRVNKLEKAVTESAERHARESRAVKAKFESYDNRFSVVKEAWGQDTPRTS